MTSLKTPIPSVTLFSQPHLLEELSSSRDTVELASKHVSKKVCEWFETWRPWQQRMLLCGLTDRCSRHQLASLATTLEPVFHRDFVTTVRQRYPSAPFRHKKEREIIKQKMAEEKRLAQVFKDEYHTRFPDAMPQLKESDLGLFNTFIAKPIPNSMDIVVPGLYTEFSDQLSARLIVSSINTLKEDPDRFNHPMVFDSESIKSVSPHILIIESPRSDSPSEEQTLPTMEEIALTVKDKDPDKLSVISEEPPVLPETPDIIAGVDVTVEDGSLPITPVDTEQSTAEPSTREDTISDPLKKKKPKKKKAFGTQLLDLPPLKVFEHGHRSAVNTASEVATVDFFLGEKSDKLGVMQREIRRGPVNKPSRIQNLMIPLQKCYKPEKMCSEDKHYVRAYGPRLKRHFKKQLRQVWAWISEWQDYETLALLSDVAKLCDSQTIQYLCQCLTARLRDRIDIDCIQDELMLKIFSLLDYHDIEISSQVCHRWRYLCNLDKLWMNKCKQIGLSQGLPNINHIIFKTRQESKQVDWKLAYLEVIKLCDETKYAQIKPLGVDYDMGTPSGMMRVDGKFYAYTPTESSFVMDKPVKKQVSQARAEPQPAAIARQGGHHDNVSDTDSDSYIDYNEYSLFREEEKTKKRRRQVKVNYDSTFDVSGKKRLEQKKEKVSDDEEGVSEKSGSKPAVRRKKRRQEEAEPALDVRPDLRQAKDLLNASVPRRTLVWRESFRSDKQKTHRFAGEVKAVQRVRKLQGHLDVVLCIAISKRRMASGSMDRSIRIWDLNTGKSIHKMYGHMGGVRCLYFEGGLLISGSWDMQVMVWDLITFDRKAVLTGHKGSISCVEFNSKYIATASHDKTVRVHHALGYDLHTIIKGHESAITCMKLDQDNLLTGSSDKTVRVSSLSSGECLKVFTLPEHITSLCFQNDLILVGNQLGQCHFLNKKTGSLEAGIEAHRSMISQVVLHKNRFYTTSSDSTVKEWDLVTMTCVRYLQGPKGAIRDLKVDDRRIVSCGDDGSIRLWDLVVTENTGRHSAHGDVIAPTVVKAT